MLGTSASGFRKERPCKYQGKWQVHSKQMLDTFLEGKKKKRKTKPMLFIQSPSFVYSADTSWVSAT